MLYDFVCLSFLSFDKTKEKKSDLTFVGLRRLLLSEIICPVLENILSEGTDVTTMQSFLAMSLLSLGYLRARLSHHLRGASFLEKEAPLGNPAPP